jgi:carboxypeptidase family protein
MLCAVILFATLATSTIAAFAESAGIVKGTVTDDHTHAPLAGVAVTASSPSATYHAVTDAQGRYAFLSMLPDNYAMSFRYNGLRRWSSSSTGRSRRST